MKQLRIPRPLGSTELSKAFHITNDNDHYNNLLQCIIHHYIRNNFSYNQQYMNIETFSYATNIGIDIIQKHIGTYGKELKLLQGNLLGEGMEMYRALNFLIFNWGLEDRSKAQQQLDLLLRSQGAKYKPFISGEVNKALKLVMDSGQNMASIMRSILGPQGSISPMPTDPGYSDQGTSKGITVDDAVMILKENSVTPLKEDNDAQEMLYLEYSISDMPEVNAMAQTGMDISKEGLGLKDITALSPTQISKLPKKEKGHTNRRAKEIEIDLDADEI